MANQPINQLPEATVVNGNALFVIEQSGAASKVKAETFRRQWIGDASKFRPLGKYATVAELQEAVPTPSLGDYYYIGAAAPYSVYAALNIEETDPWVDVGQIGSDVETTDNALVFSSGVNSGTAPIEKIVVGNTERSLARTYNPNLLDNWYFGNPVNQRGQSSYSTYSYGIDRWIAGSSNGTFTVNSGYVSCTISSGTAFPNQIIDPNIYGALWGKTLTYSLLQANGTLTTSTFTIPSSAPSANTWYGRKYFGSYSIGMYYTVSTGRFSAQFTVTASTLDVLAVKLEFGNAQTLAHQENGVWVLNEIPDYGEQLRRCQRYYQNLTNKIVRGTLNGTKNVLLPISLPTAMRITNPALTIGSVPWIRYKSVNANSVTLSGSPSVYSQSNVSPTFQIVLSSALTADTYEQVTVSMMSIAITADL